MFGALTAKFWKHLVSSWQPKIKPTSTLDHAAQWGVSPLVESNRATSSPRQQHPSRHQASGWLSTTLEHLVTWSPTGPSITPDLKASLYIHWVSLVSKCMCVLDDAWVFCLFCNKDFPNAEAGGWGCPSFTLWMFLLEWCVCRAVFSPHWGHKKRCRSEKGIAFFFCIQTPQSF